MKEPSNSINQKWKPIHAAGSRDHTVVVEATLLLSTSCNWSPKWLGAAGITASWELGVARGRGSCKCRGMSHMPAPHISILTYTYDPNNILTVLDIVTTVCSLNGVVLTACSSYSSCTLDPARSTSLSLPEPWLAWSQPCHSVSS